MRLWKHPVPPQPPSLFSSRVQEGHPQPPSRGVSCSLLPLAIRRINDHMSQQTTAEMDWCRVVGPRGLCRPLDEKQALPTNNPKTARSSYSTPQNPRGRHLGPPPSFSRADARMVRAVAELFSAPVNRTLGREPRSEPRAPMQLVSGTLGSLVTL